MRHRTRALSRRDWLRTTAGACAGFGLADRLLPLFAAPGSEPHPLAAKAPHFAPKAKRVIMFFLTGGFSHVDTFDPKPELNKRNGEAFGRNAQPLQGSRWEARPRGQSGIVTTELFPHVNSVIDDICLIRSMHGDQNDHFAAILHIHSGTQGMTLPGIGTWVSYALGTENTNLPSYIVFCKNKPYAGSQSWESNFLPAYHQGVCITPGETPVPFLKAQSDNPPSLQQAELAMLRRLNEQHAAGRPHESELVSRTMTFDTANSLQRIAPVLFDVDKEPEHIHNLYGVKPGDRQSFAWQTLVARRMLESGVRFVELFDTGTTANWDAHGNLQDHALRAKAVDQPIAALITDLKQRGMFDDTLVICATEFGRTPNGKPGGREHQCKVFSCWMAGAGLKRGYVHGASDDLGAKVAEKGVHVHDWNATILHLLGLDHERLTYRHSGRDYRLTDVHGHVVHELFA